MGSLSSFRNLADSYGFSLQLMLDDYIVLKGDFVSKNAFKLMRTSHSYEFF